ncbi:hypothetical protein ACET3X_009946 [Alternaria dauci]|uniref:Uncharacterized protein n=1 Tax=Alternaria dauci TaxID=48095 RepID=A0ABR3U6S7_9PLEO
MAVTDRDTSGGTSFFDLSGELRNIIYEHFIDLRPSARDAANLACTHKQVHSEFGTLFSLRGEIKLKVEDLFKFVYSFFVRYNNSALKDIPFEIKGMIDWEQPQSVDLLPVISIMRQYPLLKVALLEWYDGFQLENRLMFSYAYVDFAESFLTSMEAQHFDKLISVNFILEKRWAGLWVGRSYNKLLVVLKKGVPKRIVQNWAPSCCGHSYVMVRREDHLDTEYSELDSDDGLDRDEDSDSGEHELKDEQGESGSKGQEGE